MRPMSRRVWARALAGLGLVAMAACGGGSSAQAPAAPGFGIEIVVRTPANFRTVADVAAFVDQASRHGVETISLLVKQDEDGDILLQHKVELSVLRESNLPWWNVVPPPAEPE